jgi:NAD+ kinase
MSAELVRPKVGTVALYVDMERDRARTAAGAVAQALLASGYKIALCDDQDVALALASDGATVDEAVLLVTIGGDGTLLRAAQIAAPRGIPLFGVNTGRLGFLTEIDWRAGAIPEIPAMLRDGFIVDERSALEARVHGRAHLALNDIVVRRSDAHMTPFGIYVDGSQAAHVPADGVIVATPTGSTAYFLSSGGPILAPDVAAFGVIALLPHTLFTRPLVVPDSSTITLTCDSEVRGVSLEADGRTVDQLHGGDEVTVTRYVRPVCFARRKPRDFFSLLEDKLRWNAPIKDREGT